MTILVMYCMVKTLFRPRWESIRWPLDMASNTITNTPRRFFFFFFLNKSRYSFSTLHIKYRILPKTRSNFFKIVICVFECNIYGEKKNRCISSVAECSMRKKMHNMSCQNFINYHQGILIIIKTLKIWR